jgi:hypothetical protein
MKKTYLALIVLLFGTLAYSNNWQPIQIGKTYHYKLDTATAITHSITVDSVELVNSDSVFYLNRIMTKCDTCPNGDYLGIALRNQPQFLMRKMTKISDNQYLFSDTATFEIRPQSALYDVWVFDSVLEINATIYFSGVTQVFGVTDSVKYIGLSNGKTIKISKNHGILEFPAPNDKVYRLVGVEGTVELGECLPNFWDFFSYEVGDVIQLKDEHEGWGDSHSLYETTRKLTIISKNINNETITYDCSGWELNKYLYENWPTYVHRIQAYVINTTLSYTNSANHIANSFNNQMYDLNQDDSVLAWNGQFIGQINISKQNGRYVKHVGPDEVFPGYYPYFVEPETQTDTLIRTGGGVEALFHLTEGLGMDFKMYFHEFRKANYMHGRVHDGDTIGFVTPDSTFEYYASVNELPQTTLSLFPNPVKRGQKLFFGQNEVANEYTLYDFHGKVILQGKLSNSFVVPENTPTGMYFLVGTTGGKVFGEKVVVQ